jgi:hypothetical protein
MTKKRPGPSPWVYTPKDVSVIHAWRSGAERLRRIRQNGTGNDNFSSVW